MSLDLAHASIGTMAVPSAVPPWCCEHGPGSRSCTGGRRVAEIFSAAVLAALDEYYLRELGGKLADHVC
jgi:hypothetical protein